MIRKRMCVHYATHLFGIDQSLEKDKSIVSSLMRCNNNVEPQKKKNEIKMNATVIYVLNEIMAKNMWNDTNSTFRSTHLMTFSRIMFIPFK